MRRMSPMEAAGSFPATRPQGDALNRDLVTENFVCFFSVEKYFSGSWISGDEKVGHTFFCVDEPRKRQQPAAVPQSFSWQQRPEENQQKLETKHRKLSNLKRIGLPPDSSIVSTCQVLQTKVRSLDDDQKMKQCLQLTRDTWSKDSTCVTINRRLSPFGAFKFQTKLTATWICHNHFPAANLQLKKNETISSY